MYMYSTCQYEKEGNICTHVCMTRLIVNADTETTGDVEASEHPLTGDEEKMEIVDS